MLSLYVIRIGKQGILTVPPTCTAILQLFSSPSSPSSPSLPSSIHYFRYPLDHPCNECIAIPNTTPPFTLVVDGTEQTAFLGDVVSVDEPNARNGQDGQVEPTSEVGPLNGVLGVSVHLVEAPIEHRATSSSASSSTSSSASLHKLPRIDTVYARCKASMEWLDTVNRDYIQRHQFKTRSVAIRSVAGSGKTTTLLQLGKSFQQERSCALQMQSGSTQSVLYIAYNKNLVEEMKHKVRARGLSDAVQPLTFDGLVYRVAQRRFEEAGQLFEFSGALTGHELSSRYDWFQGKAYRLKK